MAKGYSYMKKNYYDKIRPKRAKVPGSSGSLAKYQIKPGKTQSASGTSTEK